MTKHQPVEELPATVDLMGLRYGNCHWPIGQPVEPADYGFCGRPSGDAPYCETHRARAYKPEHRVVVTFGGAIKDSWKR